MILIIYCICVLIMISILIGYYKMHKKKYTTALAGGRQDLMDESLLAMNYVKYGFLFLLALSPIFLAWAIFSAIRRLIAMLVLILSIQFSFSQSAVSTEQFINRFSYVAVHEMALFGIPASVTLAQGILESDSGNSKLAKKNNFFGIVCHQHTYDCAGHCMWINSSTDKNRFRIYPNAWYGFRSRSLKLYTEPRYQILFENHPNDYVAWCVALQKSGWATDPNYTHKLVQIIEKYQLWKYDIKTF